MRYYPSPLRPALRAMAAVLAHAEAAAGAAHRRLAVVSNWLWWASTEPCAGIDGAPCDQPFCRPENAEYAE